MAELCVYTKTLIGALDYSLARGLDVPEKRPACRNSLAIASLNYRREFDRVGTYCGIQLGLFECLLRKMVIRNLITAARESVIV